jgi:hypothetical protein
MLLMGGEATQQREEGRIHHEYQPGYSHPSKVKQAKAKTTPGVAIANIYRFKKPPKSKLKPPPTSAHTFGRVAKLQMVKSLKYRMMWVRVHQGGQVAN